MGAGVLHPGEEQDAHHQLTPGETGQEGRSVLRRKGETQHHEENVEQAHPADVIERLEGQTAAVIIGVAACVVVGEDVGHHGPEQDDHRHDGREAEEDEVLDSNKGSGLFAALRQPHTARDEQQRVGEVVAHHKVEVPPAGEDDGGSGQKDEAEPHRLQPVKAEVHGQQQDGKPEDEAEPVRLGQYRAHPQEGISRRQGHPEEEIVPPILHIQDLPDLDDKARQQHQQGGQDAEHLTEGVSIAGVVGETEGKLGKEGDKVCVVVGHGAQDEPKACPGALGKGGFGVVLLEQVVGVIPDVYKAPARQCPVKIDDSHSPDAEDDGFVEEAQLCACHTENAEGQNKESHAGPETEQREKEGAGRCKQPQKSQQHRTAAQTDPRPLQRREPANSSRWHRRMIPFL